jgi:hypothetical protein
MRELDVATRFSLVVVPLDTFLGLEAPEGQRRALIALGRHLQEDGLIVIDVVNPLTLPSDAEAGLVRLRLHGEFEGARLHIFDTIHIDHAAQVMEMHLIYDMSKDTVVSRETADIAIRWVYRFEMEQLCELSKLTVRQVYGDYDLSPYAASSPRMIFAVTRGVTA